MVSVALVTLMSVGTVGAVAATSSGVLAIEDLLTVDLADDDLVAAATARTDAGLLSIDPLTAPFRLGDDHRVTDPDGVTAWELTEDGTPLGWSTAGVAPESVRDGALEMRVVLEEGDKPLTVDFGLAGDGGDIEVTPDGAIDLTLPAGYAGDAAWRFTAPGAYRVAVTITAQLTSGAVASSTAGYVITVEGPGEEHDSTTTTSTSPPAVETTTTTTAPSTTTPSVTETSTTTAPPVAPAVPDTMQPSPRKTPVGATLPVEATAALAQQISDQTGVVLDDVHVDIAGLLIDGELLMVVKDGSDPAGPIWRRTSDVTLHAKPGSRISVPDDAAFDFLGAAGDDSWVLPQVQQADLLWPGWNTESLSAADIDGPVTWRLTAVDGPGDFALFVTDSFGSPSVLFDSADGLPDTMSIPLGTHAHGNWAFSSQGRYDLAFTMEARLRSGTTLGASGTVAFAVGDVDSSDDQTTTTTTTTTATTNATTTTATTTTDDSEKLPLTGAGALVPTAAVGVALTTVGLIAVGAGRPRRRDDS